ncbi:MAG TPA: TonB-dependent receptor, partial [Aggregicoccus sp.]|nr:TonB-dependent receptor [Aggregicoccus sp.]
MNPLVQHSLCLLLLSAAPAALAQTEATPEAPAASAAEPEAGLEELTELIVVTATRRPEGIATVPGSVTVVTREQLDAQMPNAKRSLGEALGKVVPGLALGNESTSTFSQTMRGRNILVLVDGVPQSAIRNVQHDLASIDPAAVERVEVVRGTTAIYGEGASGGIINIITRNPGYGEARLSTTLEASTAVVKPGQGLAGSLTHTASGALAGKWDYSLAAALSRTGGFFDARGDRIPADPQGQGGLADTLGVNVLGKLGHRLGDDQRLRLTANVFRGMQDTQYTSDPAVNAQPAGTQKALALPGLQLEDPQGSRNTVVHLDYTHEALLGSRAHALAYFRDHQTRFFPFDGRGLVDRKTGLQPYGNSVIQSRLESRKAGVRLELDTPLVEGDRGLSVLWGLDANGERTEQPVGLMDAAALDASGGSLFLPVGSRTWVPPMDVGALGLFVQTEWKALSRLTLRAGVRREQTWLNVDDYTTLAGVDVSGNALDFGRTLFNAGAVVAVTDAVSTFVNFSQGFSLPDVGLILRNAAPRSPGEPVSVESLNTAPQRVDLVEAGVRGQWRPVQASVSVYANRSKLGSSSAGLFAPIVRAPERVYGLEATLGVQPTEKVALSSSLTWLEGQLDVGDDGSYEFLNNYRIPPLKLTAGVEHQTLPGWRNGLTFVYSGHRDRFPGSTAFGQREVNEYFTFDLASSLDVRMGTLRLGVANLLNRQYFPRESQLLRSGRNDTLAAARGATVTLGYT